jgi:NAD(P)-dependent dehydrogenase (short-subunit alcohol dehydrogenase family)
MSVLKMLQPRAGLRVLVTGGGSGIGLVIAQAFAETGARVHVCDASQQALDALRADPGNEAISATLADVSDKTAVARVFADVQDKLGGLDVLLNNAGIAGPLLKKSPDGGAIIAMASVAGRLGYAFRTPYSATKFALTGLTQSLAIELGPSNIRVNAIQPGVVRGPRMERVIAARAQQLGLSYAEMEAKYLEKISLRRMTTQEEVAATVLFLCSPGGSGISGQSISVCGNVEVL